MATIDHDSTAMQAIDRTAISAKGHDEEDIRKISSFIRPHVGNVVAQELNITDDNMKAIAAEGFTSYWETAFESFRQGHSSQGDSTAASHPAPTPDVTQSNILGSANDLYRRHTHLAPTIRPSTDSGYGSLGLVHGVKNVKMVDTYDAPEYLHPASLRTIEDDARTVYSETMSASDPRVENHVAQMAEELLTRLGPEALTPEIVEGLARAIPGLLRGLALSIGHEAPSQMHRDTMFFLHKHRRQVNAP